MLQYLQLAASSSVQCLYTPSPILLCETVFDIYGVWPDGAYISCMDKFQKADPPHKIPVQV